MESLSDGNEIGFGLRQSVLDPKPTVVAMNVDGRWIYLLPKSTEPDIWMLDLSENSSR